MRSFGSRTPIPIGIVSIAVIVLALLAAVYSDDLPIIGGGTTYGAAFSEAAGLQADDEVRIAGVQGGKGKDIKLDRDQALARVQAQDALLGARRSPPHKSE